MHEMKLTGRLRLMTVCVLSALMVSACGGGGGGGDTSSSAGTQTLNKPQVAPTNPTISYDSSHTQYAKKDIAFSANATDPAGLTLSYTWDFGDGTTAPGKDVTHQYKTSGAYTVKVTVSNTANLSVSTSQIVTIASADPSVPVITSSAPSTAKPGQPVAFSATSSDPQGLSVSYQWDFGDGSSATGSSVSHAFANAGNYTVSVTATDSSGYQASSSMTQGVVAAPSSNALTADCAGANCAAVNATTYSGSGIGVWRYDNTSGSSANIDINISGVQPGNKAVLVFSNGSTNIAPAPSAGTLLSATSTPRSTPRAVVTQEMAAYQKSHAQHMSFLEKNRKLAESWIHAPASRAKATIRAMRPAASPLAAPAVGDSRVWNDLYGDDTNPVPYSTKANTICTLPSGRRVVFWLDPTAAIVNDDMAAMQNAVCGNNGGFAQLGNMLGDVWGSTPAQYASSTIQDAQGALQDINIVIANVPSSTRWAGYFYNYNNFLKTASGTPNSNQALVFFINAGQIKQNRNYTISALLHEATHMTNFYQRAVLRGTSHDTWLEETSAMLSEDVIAPALLGGYDTAYNDRIPGYLQTGGGASYTEWSNLSSASYSLGGSFGAFLNRRYGTAIFKQLITNCADGSGYGIDSSYACLDKLIVNNGGKGFADEFARYGASIFATLPATGLPDHYGFPFKTDGGYQFSAFDVSKYKTVPASSLVLMNATSQTYQVDNINDTSYKRTGVTIPAKTTMILVIR